MIKNDEGNVLTEIRITYGQLWTSCLWATYLHRIWINRLMEERQKGRCNWLNNHTHKVSLVYYQHGSRYQAFWVRSVFFFFFFTIFPLAALMMQKWICFLRQHKHQMHRDYRYINDRTRIKNKYWKIAGM